MWEGVEKGYSPADPSFLPPSFCLSPSISPKPIFPCHLLFSLLSSPSSQAVPEGHWFCSNECRSIRGQLTSMVEAGEVKVSPTAATAIRQQQQQQQGRNQPSASCSNGVGGADSTTVATAAAAAAAAPEVLDPSEYTWQVGLSSQGGDERGRGSERKGWYS
jgi:hypothetical protein